MLCFLYVKLHLPAIGVYMRLRIILLGLLLMGCCPLYAADQEPGLSTQESLIARLSQDKGAGGDGELKAGSQMAKEEPAARLKHLLEHLDKRPAIRDVEGTY